MEGRGGGAHYELGGAHELGLASLYRRTESKGAENARLYDSVIIE